jgi:hypothetical protein
MKIKEFFSDCAYCNHIWIFVCRIDESGERYFKSREIYNPKDLNDFIIDYGNREIVKWSVENSKDDTDITFYLKSQ